MPDKKKVLTIDDNPDMLRLLTMLLSKNDYIPITAENGAIGLELVEIHQPDLIILDLSLPGIDGWEVCEQIREHSTVPIIILTAAHVTDEDTIRGLDLGANDYIIKPFKNNVMLARIRNALRWVTLTENSIDYDDGHLKVDLPNRQVFLNNDLVKLTRKEFNMLVVLVDASPKVVSHRKLFDNVWDNSYDFDVNYVRIFIGHLRKKIEIDPAHPVYIHNERGIGYRFLKQ
ncbi:MAG: response regulator transcription factor [Chloroflexi bacterium]|nr:response regulator transcription factor [Chloroflexota bacterium]